MKKKVHLAVVLIALSSLLIPFGLANAGTYAYIGQDVTAYVAADGALTYSGTTPSQYITAAVHPAVLGDPKIY